MNTNCKAKELTKAYNSMKVKDRIELLFLLTEDKRNNLIDKLSNQAVKDFWTYEQELIKNGLNTHNWTAEQIEDIYEPVDVSKFEAGADLNEVRKLNITCTVKVRKNGINKL